MSSVFLFGAGASYGSGNCYPEPPPLGNGVNGLFKKLQEKGGVAASLPSALAELFIKNFEEGMAEFYSTREPQLIPFLKEMSLYFLSFEPLEGNLYKELIQAIALTKHQVVFATTNYDLLIEYAIGLLGYMGIYHGLPVPKNIISVLKIHGSCNFLPNTQGAKFTNASFNNCGVYIDAPIKIAQPHEVIKFCQQEDSQAPVIAMYAKGKPIKFCPKAVLQQQKFWQESVFKAKKVFVVGLSVNSEDTHIWQVLASSKAQLLYFGFSKKDEEDFDEWKKRNSRKNAHWIKGGFGEAIPIIKSHLK
jgi:hypothetical protein